MKLPALLCFLPVVLVTSGCTGIGAAIGMSFNQPARVDHVHGRAVYGVPSGTEVVVVGNSGRQQRGYYRTPEGSHLVIDDGHRRRMWIPVEDVREVQVLKPASYTGTLVGVSLGLIIDMLVVQSLLNEDDGPTPTYPGFEP